MRDVLVIQWARLGDLLHTRVLLNSLRRLHPDARIALSHDAKYEEVVCLFPEVDTKLPIDLKKSVDLSRTESGWPDALDSLLASFAQNQFDNVINLTNHPSACWFAQATTSGQVSGYAMRGGTEQIPGPLQVLLDCKSPMRAPCHIADLWCEVADPDGGREFPAMLWGRGNASPDAIALIADAGAPSRCLTEHALHVWSETLRANEDCTIFWTGSQVSRETTSPNHVIDLRGRTSLPKLVKVLSSCKLVIGPDTGALHLAAALGCETIGVYLDGARPERTGPYAPHASCFVANELNDKTVAKVASLISGRNTGGQSVHGSEWFTSNYSDRGIEYSSTLSSRHINEGSVDLSIIITEFGQTHYADNLLIQLRQADTLPKHEIIVSSSGPSPDDTIQAKSRLHVVQLTSDTPRTFSEACNQAAAVARGQWLLFVNDDTDVTGEALRILWNGREKRTIVAPELQFWDGVRQSAGIAVRPCSVAELGFGTRAEVEDEPDGVSAAAMLVYADVFRELQGFDESYINGFEDVDFCLRAKLYDIKSMCVKEAKLIHYRGSSPQRYDRDIANEALFWSHWKDSERELPKTRRSAEFAQLVILSSCEENEAGPQSRWVDPLCRLLDDLELQFSWVCTNGSFEIDSVTAAIEQAKAIVVFRNIADDRILSDLLRWKNESCGPLVLDADDLILNRFPMESPRAARRKQIEDEFRALQEAADICAAPSIKLLDMHEVPEHKRHVLSSRPIRGHFADRDHQRTDEFIRIGFAGSPAHQIDFAQAAVALEILLEESEDAFFFWWGCHPGKLAYHPQVRHGGPWLSNYEAHLERLQRVPIDFWIVPLNESVHNSVRSPIRAFECCGMGAPVLVSNVDPYRSLPDNSKLLTKVENNARAWLQALQSLATRVRLKDSISPDDPMLELMQAKSSDSSDYIELFDRVRMMQQVSLQLKRHQLQKCEP